MSETEAQASLLPELAQRAIEYASEPWAHDNWNDLMVQLATALTEAEAALAAERAAHELTGERLGECDAGYQTLQRELATSEAAREEAERELKEQAEELGKHIDGCVRVAAEALVAQKQAERKLAGDPLGAELVRALIAGRQALSDKLAEALAAQKQAEAELEDEKWEGDRTANRLAIEIDALTSALAGAREERDEIVRIIAANRNMIRAEGPACCMRTLRHLVKEVKAAVPAVAEALSLPTTEPQKQEEKQ